MAEYITRSGWHVLDEELKYLWREKRPEITKAVSEAAALGDRSENAEYIYGKKQLREIDRRLRFLAKRLEILQIVDYHPDQEGKIFFGAYFTLEDDDGIETTFRLVGGDEFDPKQKHISVKSPLARAAIGRSLGDEFYVNTPNGRKNYIINNIWYEK